MKASATRVLVGVALLLPLAPAWPAETIKSAYYRWPERPRSIVGAERFKAFQAAVELVNSRGGVLGGKQFEVVPYDNKFNAQETLVVLRKAIDEGVQYVLAGTSLPAGAINDALLKLKGRETNSKCGRSL